MEWCAAWGPLCSQGCKRFMSCLISGACFCHILVDQELRYSISLCLAVIIGLPAATPKEYMNSASYALGNFTNCGSNSRGDSSLPDCRVTCSERLARWICLLSELPRSIVDHLYVPIDLYMLFVLMSCLANFDFCVHISEESSNAAIAVPWAIVSH